MYKSIDYEQIVGNGEDNYLLLDVRSPEEYEEATIPGAVNVPLFSNEERQEVGTVYHHVSVEEAKRLGIAYVSKRLPQIYERIMQLRNQNNKRLVVFCARGGMRSSSLVSLFSTLGIQIEKLKGGYKGYRQYINERLPGMNDGIQYIVLHGNTGVGKTQILEKLKCLGHDVLDLEKCANNRGSLLGAVGLGASYSQKQFDSLLFNALKARKSSYMFVEAESKRVGNINIPDYVFESMKNGTHIRLTADMEFRSELLVEEYTRMPDCDEEIRKALDKLKKYIGESNRQRFEQMLERKEYEQLSIELMEKYYDPMYEHESKKYKYALELNVESIESCTNLICEWFSTHKDRA